MIGCGGVAIGWARMLEVNEDGGGGGGGGGGGIPAEGARLLEDDEGGGAGGVGAPELVETLVDEV